MIAFDKRRVIDKLMADQALRPARAALVRQAARAAGHRSGPTPTSTPTPAPDHHLRHPAVRLARAADRRGRLRPAAGHDPAGSAHLDMDRTATPSCSTAGDVIVRPDMTAANARWNEPFRTENLLRSPSGGCATLAQAHGPTARGRRAADLQGQPTYIAYAPITTAGWSVGMVIPDDDIIQPGRRARPAHRPRARITCEPGAAAAGAVPPRSAAGQPAALALLHPADPALQRRRAGSGRRPADHRLPRPARTRLASWSDAFNAMTGSLQEKVAELEENASQLARLNPSRTRFKRILDSRAAHGHPRRRLRALRIRPRGALPGGGRHAARRGRLVRAGQRRAGRHIHRAAANADPDLRVDGGTVEADVVRSGKAVIVDDPWDHPRVLQTSASRRPRRATPTSRCRSSAVTTG